MKRVWFGGILLGVLLAVGLAAGWAMEGLGGAGEKLERAGALAMVGRWEAAEELLEDAEDDWDRRRWLTTALSDHEIIEDMDAALGELEAYAQVRDTVAFRALSRALARKMDAVSHSHTATGENFF